MPPCGIEDSAAGANAARAAGVPVIVTRSRYTGEDEIGTVLADLSGLGESDAAGEGTVRGRAWRGVVDLDTLRRWHLGRSTGPCLPSAAAPQATRTNSRHSQQFSSHPGC